MQFRLLTVLYVFALLAAGMAVFGGWGIFAALYLCGVWHSLLKDSERGLAATLFSFIIAAVVVLLPTTLLVVGLPSVRYGYERNHCNHSLKAKYLGLANYESAKGTLPSATILGETSQFSHSWRIAITPFLESSNVYARYDWTKSFDSQTNVPVTNNTSFARAHYGCLAASDALLNDTEYFAVVGPGTAWDRDLVQQLDDIKDRRGDTILLIEAANQNIPWTKPQDLTVEQGVKLLTGQSPDAILHHDSRDTSWFYVRNSRHVNVAMADGDIRYLSIPLEEKIARALLTANGGEVIPPGTLDALTETRLNYARIYGLCVFLVLALLPGLVVWRRRSRTSPPEAVMPS